MRPAQLTPENARIVGRGRQPGAVASMRPAQLTPENESCAARLWTACRASMRPAQLTPENPRCK